jgi:hypothetical protein
LPPHAGAEEVDEAGEEAQADQDAVEADEAAQVEEQQ